jgi:hypothetical protein
VGVHHYIGRNLQGKGRKSSDLEGKGKVKAKQGEEGAPMKRVHSSRASKHKEIKNSKAS